DARVAHGVAEKYICRRDRYAAHGITELHWQVANRQQLKGCIRNQLYTPATLLDQFHTFGANFVDEYATDLAGELRELWPATRCRGDRARGQLLHSTFCQIDRGADSDHWSEIAGRQQADRRR